MSSKRPLSWRRIIFAIAVVVAAAVGGFCFGDEFQASEKPAEYIAVIFSILAASLFAVISIVGDPGMIVQGSAKRAWVNARELQRELHRFNFLFYMYLITLGLLVASELIESAGWTSFFWASKLFAGFAIGSFLYSFVLPIDFMALQKRRLEQEIASRTR